MNAYAFEWCSCIFESGFSAVSLHMTKRGAYKAMRAYLLAEHESWTQPPSRKCRIDKPLQHCAWRVRQIEIQPE